MKESPYRLSRLTQIRNSLYLRRAAWFRRPTAIKNMPEPWSIGQHERGKQLVSGHFLFKGQEIDFRNGAPGIYFISVDGVAPKKIVKSF